MKRKLIIFLIFWGICATSSFGLGEVPKQGAAFLAPDFTLSDLAGNKITLSNYKGKVVFLNFWATWCPPCREEMPSMQVLYEKFKGKNFEMLAVSIDSQVSKVIDFVKSKSFTFPVLLDPEKKVAGIYNVSGIPATFIIDKKGRVMEREIGSRDWADEEVMRKLGKLAD